MKSIYAEQKKGDGFITQKIFSESLFLGYEIIRLSTGESRLLSLKSGLFPPDEIPVCTRGAFSFFGGGFSFADRIIDDIIQKGTSPVFIDEIGPLELQGKGHHDSFKKIIRTDSTIYFTVRNFRVNDVISFFSLQNYTLIRI